jgi:MTH538 TIR-like domain (DUF1863)
MAQIFISHSAKDTKPLDFLNRAFATTNIQAKYEEIEAIVTGRRTTLQIRTDINASRAIIVVLGPHAQALSHTRDWIVWESGNASGIGKDIWVLEAFEDSCNLSIVIPHLRHYVAFDYTDPWLSYLRQVIASYDDSQAIKILAATTGLGALIGEGPGALIGGGIGVLLAFNAQPKAPSGFPFTCPKCQSIYNIHIFATAMRCPVCNIAIRFEVPMPIES